jgi:hypothetical protein
MSARGGEHQSPEEAGVVLGQLQGDEATAGLSEQDRAFDAKYIEQSGDITSPRSQVPVRALAPVASAVATKVDRHELGQLAEVGVGEAGLAEHGVVGEALTAV